MLLKIKRVVVLVVSGAILCSCFGCATKVQSIPELFAGYYVSNGNQYTYDLNRQKRESLLTDSTVANLSIPVVPLKSKDSIEIQKMYSVFDDVKARTFVEILTTEGENYVLQFDYQFRGNKISALDVKKYSIVKQDILP